MEIVMTKFTVKQFEKSLDKFFDNIDHNKLALMLQKNNVVFYDKQCEFIAKEIKKQLKCVLNKNSVVDKITNKIGGEVEIND